MWWAGRGSTEDLVLVQTLSRCTLPESTLSNNSSISLGHLALVPGEQQIRIWLCVHIPYGACETVPEAPAARVSLLPAPRFT